jgi:hypothetical protein
MIENKRVPKAVAEGLENPEVREMFDRITFYPQIMGGEVFYLRHEPNRIEEQAIH